MYSYEDRMKAVNLLIKNDLQYAITIRMLGYPDRKMLHNWYQEFKTNGELKRSSSRTPKYSQEQIDTALKYYYEHGQSASNTVRKLGYPSLYQFSLWLDKYEPDRKKRCSGPRKDVEFTKEYKKEATIALCSRSNESVADVAKSQNVSSMTLYNWKNELLGKEYDSTQMKNIPKESKVNMAAETESLRAEKERLEKEVFRLQLEYDILEKATEVLKKGKGVNLDELTNKEKAEVIDALRNKYRLSILLKSLCLSKSSYCYQAAALKREDKYLSLRSEIKGIFEENKRRYGYRRIHTVLKNQGIFVSEKVVRRIMNEENLAVPFVKVKKYSSYQGEITPAVDNLVQRNFHAERPNMLWLTDITEFHIPAGKVYLSPLIDCFDGLPVSWTIGTSPNADLVNTMLLNAIAGLKDGEKPMVHSDRGAHYRWPEWIKIMDSNGLTRSMSKKGCSPDNAACEGFHGRIKNEFFYNVDWRDVSIDEFINLLDEYLHWYSDKRIKISLGGLSPTEYRKKLGLTA